MGGCRTWRGRRRGSMALHESDGEQAHALRSYIAWQATWNHVLGMTEAQGAAALGARMTEDLARVRQAPDRVEALLDLCATLYQGELAPSAWERYVVKTVLGHFVKEP